MVNERDSNAAKKNKLKEKEVDIRSDIWRDARFQHLISDPRFRGISKKQRKVRIDKRFQHMFTDEKFQVKYTVDKYGRPVNKRNSNDLRKFYDLESSDEENETIASEPDTEIESDSAENEEERRAEELAIRRKSDEQDFVNNAVERGDGYVPKKISNILLDPDIDYARGEGCLLTDSSSDDENLNDSENDHMLQIDHVWGELDNDAEETDKATRRLAVCNMDWDRIRAQDIMVLLNSFLPPNGSLLSVKIYPSEFGKQRMAEDDLHGPNELISLGTKVPSDSKASVDNYSHINDNENSDEDSIGEGRIQDSDAEEGDDYHMEKLRRYQLNRLRYYYGVVECDSAATAEKLYSECDGLEFESSATRVDLRFIPDDTSFDDDVPSDVCIELPNLNTYKPRQFTTTALQQARVDLTWDETALERRELSDKLSSGKLDEISDKDLRQIMAYSSDEDSEDNNLENINVETIEKSTSAKASDGKPAINNKKQKEKEMINKYKTLLSAITEQEKKAKQKKYEMEMTWEIGENRKSAGEEEAKIDIKAKQLTPIEKIIQKRSEINRKRKELRRRRKLEAQGIDSNQSDDDSIPDSINMNDPYFAEEFTNGDFIKPPTKKKTRTKNVKDGNDDEEAHQAQELQLLLDDDVEDVHFSLEKILKTEQESVTSKKKRRKQLKKSRTESKIEDAFQINVSDPRFSAIYSSHEFNIDPTDSHFKKTKGMEQIIEEKLKRRHENIKDTKQISGHDTQPQKRSKNEITNILLAKNLNRKIKQTIFK